MLLSEKTILEKTKGGLDIYLFILRKYYPEVRPETGADNFLPTFNPFNKGRNTLVIRSRNGIYTHSDLELPRFRGNAFDFAYRYYQAITQKELFNLINSDFQLQLKDRFSQWMEERKKPWQPKFSFFEAPIRNVKPSMTISLEEVHQRITDGSYSRITRELRSISDPDEARKYKAEHFPYVTFSGVFSSRKDENLIAESNLLVVDLDHLEDVEGTRKKLLETTPFATELLFVSPSGTGLKWVLRKGPFEHGYFFRGIAAYLKDKMGLEADSSGRDLSRACFLAEDSWAHISI